MSIQSLRKATFAICLLAVGLFAAENPFAGTWKVNAAKSKLTGSGIGPNGGVRVESDGKTYKAFVDTTDEKGQPVKYDYEATLDGKASKVTGSAVIDELSLKRVNGHTIDATGKKDGQWSTSSPSNNTDAKGSCYSRHSRQTMQPANSVHLRRSQKPLFALSVS